MGKIKLREYQKEAIDAIEGSVAFGAKEVILKAPTSFGKSITIAGLCERFVDKNIVVLVNIESLIDQIAFFLKELNIDYSIMKASREDEFREDSRVKIVMSQTFYARIEKQKIHADLIIQDEIHKEFDTQRTKAILSILEPETRIGTTATPYDASGFKLSSDADIIETASCDDLTQQGFLAPVEYYVPRWAEKESYGSIKKSGNDYNISILDEKITSDKYIKNVLDSMNNMDAKNKKTIVFCSSIEQCDSIEQALIGNGYGAAAYHSKKTKKENERIMRSFKYNEHFIGTDEELENKTLFNYNEESKDGDVIKCLISVSKLTTGFSVEDIDLGVVARPTLVRALWNQMAGRLRRKSDSLSMLIDDLIKENALGNKKIAIITSVYNEVDEIKRQLEEMRISYIDVFEYGIEPEEYDIVINDVRPNKKKGEILDLGQCINNHGFPEEPYNPPEKSDDQLENKRRLLEATNHLRAEFLSSVIDSDKPERITRKEYELRLENIKRNSKKLTEMTVRELSNKLSVSQDPTEIIAITIVMMDKIHSSDGYYNRNGRPARGYTASNGKDIVDFVNPGSISWIADYWNEKLEKEDKFYKQKYIKALKTRCNNIILDKKSIWGIRFFIDFLLEQDETEKQITNMEPEEEHGYENNVNNNVGYEIIIEDEEIPF